MKEWEVQPSWLVDPGAWLAAAGWGQPRAARGGTYQGLMGLVTRERQKSVCRSRRRHSHSIWPEP